MANQIPEIEPKKRVKDKSKSKRKKNSEFDGVKGARESKFVCQKKN